MDEEIRQRLDEIARELRLLRTPLPSRCLSVREAADVLGLAPATVQRLINSGELAALRMTFGGRKVYRVQAQDLDAFIAEKKKPSAWEGEETIKIPNYD